MRLGKSDYAQEGTRCHVHVASIRLVFGLEFPFLDILGHNVVMQGVRNGRIERLSVGNESSHHISIDCLMSDILTPRGNEILVNSGDVSGQHLILLLISLVEEQEDKVETGQKSLRQIDVLIRTLLLVVPAVDGVSCGQDRSSSIEAGRYSSLGDRHGLLLHNFVDVCAVSVVHLVELINATDACVCQDESATFEDKLTRHWVLEHGSRETHS